MTANEFQQAVAQGLFASDRVAGRLKMLREFNIFRALRLDQHEIRHSNMIGWLLTDESRQPQRLAISQYLGVIKSRSDMMTREERSEWLDVYLSQKEAFDTIFEISRNVVQEMILGEIEKEVGDGDVDSQVKTCSVNVRPQFLVNGLSEYLGECPFVDEGKAKLDVYWYDNGLGAKTPYRFWFSPDRDPWRWSMSLTVRLEGLTAEQQRKVRYLDGRIFDVEHQRTPGWTRVWHQLWKTETKDFSQIPAGNLEREIRDWVKGSKRWAVDHVAKWLVGTDIK